ncbi:hypothetical protein CC78DRAFT_579167 [Lojkania enalia]|uniref:Uncharacterized protein n=1 Tax=Lojkania enalia TaxID=147567 RepID=A0A9P4KGG0_9PLEO|nr:hypothetical protein CC78DRAFT_579167 [Didymosphaeria enalia]
MATRRGVALANITNAPLCLACLSHGSWPHLLFVGPHCLGCFCSSVDQAHGGAWLGASRCGVVRAGCLINTRRRHLLPADDPRQLPNWTPGRCSPRYSSSPSLLDVPHDSRHPVRTPLPVLPVKLYSRLPTDPLSPPDVALPTPPSLQIISAPRAPH